MRLGELQGLLVRPYDIRPGNAVMYYPEANVLVPRDVDPRSKTPAFKSVMVEIVAEPVAEENSIGGDEWLAPTSLASSLLTSC